MTRLKTSLTMAYVKLPRIQKLHDFRCAFPNWPASIKWRALGLVVRIAPGPQMVMIQRLKDDHRFQSREEAEVHALELAKQWVIGKWRNDQGWIFGPPGRIRIPNLRSEVRSSSFSQQTAKKKSPLFIGERAFSLSLRLIPCDSGNKNSR
jgi:hypothetical protein